MDFGEPPMESMNMNMQPQIVLPHSIEAEKAVLGSVLRNPDNISSVENVLKPEHFFNSASSKNI